MKHTYNYDKRRFTDEEELFLETRIEALQLARPIKKQKFKTHKKKNKQDWINEAYIDE